MIRNLFLGLSLIVGLSLSAQKSEILPADPAFIAKYANFDFKGNFSAAISEDDTKNYFILDFSKFPTRFERVYFMNLSFSSDEIVNIDSDIAKDRICFMAYKKYKAADVSKIFDEIKTKVTLVASSWSEDKKAQWLSVNDKYK
jgi:hypothetical protein